MYFQTLINSAKHPEDIIRKPYQYGDELLILLHRPSKPWGAWRVWNQGPEDFEFTKTGLKKLKLKINVQKSVSYKNHNGCVKNGLIIVFHQKPFANPLTWDLSKSFSGFRRFSMIPPDFNATFRPQKTDAE